jgi:hypothetical protein
MDDFILIFGLICLVVGMVLGFGLCALFTIVDREERKLHHDREFDRILEGKVF